MYPSHIIELWKITFEEGQEEMVPYTFKLPNDLLSRAKEKAGLIPLSAIIRRLLELWLSGKVQID